jgi:hypothetical protein
LNERSSREEKLMNKKRYLLIMGIVAAAVLLSILFYTMLANHRPVITSLEAEPERVLPSGSCQIVCTASDRDGDELSYEWSATGGNISGTSAVVNWIAPEEVGTYDVTVVVTDGYGGSATDSLPINVSSGTADRVDVVYFHRTQRCSTCIYAEEGTRYTLETYFADELASGKVTFQSINVQDEANADIVEKYNNASYLTLCINTARDGTDHIEVVTDIWLVIGNDEAFVEIVKSKIEKSLGGEA